MSRKGEKIDIPPQHQERQPGRESEMRPRPEYEDPEYRGCGKLSGRAALITGGDSGIGRAVSVLFAKEGADISIVYLEEQGDAEETAARVEEIGSRCVLLRGDLRDEEFCSNAVEQTVGELGSVDVLVNNAGWHVAQESFEDITSEQFDHTFKANMYSMFYMTRAALPYLSGGSTIINTTSVTAYKGSAHLVDYSASKGAIVAYTRSLAESLLPRGIRVNAVAPGPVWTPLIASGMPEEFVGEKFEERSPMRRPAQPREISPSFLFLACEDSTFMTGQVLHPNGGTVVNG
jgi:NAD(P)-dependent dehydrogenase (short-subunit alcohol dehydrogenase family)